MPRLHSVPYMASHANRSSSTQIYIGFALALFEDVPMGIIGLHFLAVKYQIPLFQAISVVVSWLLLGMKISGIKTLPTRWAKLQKWRKFAPESARAESAATMLGTELGAAVFSENVKSAELTDVEVFDELSELGARIELASRRLAGAKGVESINEELKKMRHRLTILADSAVVADPASVVTAPPSTAGARHEYHWLARSTRLARCALADRFRLFGLRSKTCFARA